MIQVRVIVINKSEYKMVYNAREQEWPRLGSVGHFTL